MKTYICDYAAISPDTMVDAIEYAFPHASAIWKDKDEDSFEVTVVGVAGEMLDELDDVMTPYLLDQSYDWDNCDNDCGFDPYMGCYTDDC